MHPFYQPKSQGSQHLDPSRRDRVGSYSFYKCTSHIERPPGYNIAEHKPVFVQVLANTNYFYATLLTKHNINIDIVSLPFWLHIVPYENPTAETYGGH